MFPFKFTDARFFTNDTFHEMALMRPYNIVSSKWYLSQDEATNTRQIYSELTFSGFYVLIPLSFTAFEKITEIFLEIQEIKLCESYLAYKRVGFGRVVASYIFEKVLHRYLSQA